MSGLYADITGPGSETAAKMAAEDFGGEVLGRKIEIVAADHLNKADLSANIARDMFDNQGVEMRSSTWRRPPPRWLPAKSPRRATRSSCSTARARSASPTRPAVPTPSTTCSTPSAQANVTGLATVKQGLDSWFFLTADYAFGQELEKDTTKPSSPRPAARCWAAVQHPLNTSDFSSFLLQAQSLQGQGDRPRQCRRRHHQRDQAGRRVRPDQGRPEARRRCWPSSPTSTASVWRPRRACCWRKRSIGTSTTTRARSPSASRSAPSACRPRRRPASIRR